MRWLLLGILYLANILKALNLDCWVGTKYQDWEGSWTSYSAQHKCTIGYCSNMTTVFNKEGDESEYQTRIEFNCGTDLLNICDTHQNNCTHSEVGTSFICCCSHDLCNSSSNHYYTSTLMLLSTLFLIISSHNIM